MSSPEDLAYWYRETKAAREAEMAPCNSLKTRIRAYLRLSSSGFSSEKAMKLRKAANLGTDPELCVRMRQKDAREGTEVSPIRVSDIRDELHRHAVRYYRSAKIKKDLSGLKETIPNLRRALAELEEDGICERRRTSDGRPIRELSEEESRKLSNGKTRIYCFSQPRPATAESVRRNYEERLHENLPSGGSQYCLPFDPEVVRDIRYIVNGLRLSDSPLLRLSEETPEENVEAIAHTIDKTRVFFVDTLKTERPEAFGELSADVRREDEAKTEIQQPAAESAEITRKEKAADEAVTTSNVASHNRKPGVETKTGQQPPRTGPKESEVLPSEPEYVSNSGNSVRQPGTRADNKPRTGPQYPQGWPKTVAAVRRRYPTADKGIGEMLAARAQKAFSAFSEPKISALTDSLLATAVEVAARLSPKQKVVGLFFTTVPNVIATWAEQGITQDIEPEVIEVDLSPQDRKDLIKARQILADPDRTITQVEWANSVFLRTEKDRKAS